MKQCKKVYIFFLMIVVFLSTAFFNINAESEVVGIIKNVFPDATSANLVRSATGKSTINDMVTQNDLDKVETMYSNSRFSGDFEGYQYLRNLKKIDFTTSYEMNEDIKTISQLEKISNLEHFRIPVGQIEDFSFVQKHKNLRYLHTNTQKYKSTDFINNHKSLETLYIGSTMVDNMELVDVPNLRVFGTNFNSTNLRNNNLKSLHFKNLPKLDTYGEFRLFADNPETVIFDNVGYKIINLYSKVSDELVAKNNKNLTELKATENNSINSVRVENNGLLNRISFEYNSLNNFILNKDHSSLTNIYLRDNNLSSLDFSGNLDKLTSIYIQNNKIENLIVKDLPAFTGISFIDNPIKTVEFKNLDKFSGAIGNDHKETITNIESLTYDNALNQATFNLNAFLDTNKLIFKNNDKMVNLGQNSSGGITPKAKEVTINGSKELDYVNLNNLGIEKIFINAESITRLYLRNNKIESTKSITNLPKLYYLILLDNPIKDLQLKDLDSLESLEFNNLNNSKLTNVNFDNIGSDSKTGLNFYSTYIDAPNQNAVFNDVNFYNGNSCSYSLINGNYNKVSITNSQVKETNKAACLKMSKTQQLRTLKSNEISIDNSKLGASFQITDDNDINKLDYTNNETQAVTFNYLKLDNLNLSGNKMTSLALNNMTRLKTVRLSDIENLKNVSYYRSTNIEDIVYDNLPSLESAVGTNLKLKDLQLTNLPELKSINFENNILKNVKFEYIDNINSIILNNNQLSNLEFMDGISYNGVFRANYNKISDIHQLENVTGTISLTSQEVDLKDIPRSDVVTIENKVTDSKGDIIAPHNSYYYCYNKDNARVTCNKNKYEEPNVIYDLTGIDQVTKVSYYFSGANSFYGNVYQSFIEEDSHKIIDMFEDINVAKAVAKELNLDVNDKIKESNLTKINSLRLQEITLSSYEGIEKLVSLETLILNNVTVENYYYLSNISTLKELRISNKSILKIELNNIPSLASLYLNTPKLEELTLSNLAINSFGYTNKSLTSLTLNEMNYLEDVNVSDNNITKLVTSKLPVLTKLNAANNKLDKIEGLEAQENLKSLFISNNNFKDISMYNDNVLVNAPKQTIKYKMNYNEDGSNTYQHNVDIKDQSNKKIEPFNISHHGSVDNNTISWKDINSVKGFTFKFESELFNGKVTLYFNDPIKVGKYSDIFEDDNLASVVASLYNKTANDYATDIELDNIQYLDVSSQHIKSLAGLEVLTNLVELNLENNKIKNIDNLAILTKLEKISARQNNINSTDILTHSSSIKVIDLRDNMLTKVILKDKDNLNELYLNSNIISELELRNLDNLNTVTVLDNKLENVIVDSLSKLNKLSLNKNEQIKSLEINKTSLTKVEMNNGVLSEVKLNDNNLLEMINLKSNRIQNISLEKLPNLKSINLAENALSNFSAGQDTKNIEKLDLSSNKISNIDSLNSLTNLNNLNINNNNITSIAGLDFINKISALDQVFEMPIVEETTKLSVPNFIKWHDYTLVDVLNSIPKSHMVNDNIEFDDITGYNNVKIKWYKKQGDITFNGVVDIPVNTTSEGYVISEIFPDPVFAIEIATQLGLNVDDKVTQKQLDEIKSIVKPTANMTSIEGAQYLTNIEELNIESNKLTTIDQINNKQHLTNLLVNNNPLTNLNMENLPLSTITINGGSSTLKDVTLKDMPNLKNVYLSSSRITTFNTEGTENIEIINLSSNQIESIDIDNLPNLNNLNIDYNKLKSFKISDNNKLAYLSVSGSADLNELIIDNMSVLTNITFSDKKLKTINITKTNLEYMTFKNNVIEEVGQFEHIRTLKNVNLDNNKIHNLVPLYYVPTIYARNQNFDFNDFTQDDDSVMQKNHIRDPKNEIVEPTLLTAKGYYKNDMFVWDKPIIHPKPYVTFNKTYSQSGWTYYFSGVANVEILKNEELGKISTVFADPAIANVVASRLSKTVNDDVTTNELASIITIDVSSNYEDGETIFKGVEYLTGLETFSYTNTRITNISDDALNVMKDLREMKSFYINSKITDISYLKNMKKLTTLTIINSLVTDATVIKNFENVTQFNLYNNKIDKIEFGSHSKLTYIYLQNNNLTDVTISDKTDLSILYEINISNNNFTDISFLDTAQKTLYNLTASKNNIDNIDDIKLFTYLRYLNLDNNKLVNYPEFSKDNQLHQLNLNNNLLESITFNNYSQLYYLYLSNNPLKTFEANNLGRMSSITFDGFKDLESVTINKSVISNITIRNTELNSLSLNQNTNLNTLNLNNNKLTKIEKLTNSPRLATLNISDNSFRDIDSLSYALNLSTLYMNNNKLTSISNIKDMVSLNNLQISNNNIRDISELSSLSELTTLEANNNRIKDISSLTQLGKLNSIKLDNNNIGSIKDLPGQYSVINQEVSGDIIYVNDSGTSEYSANLKAINNDGEKVIPTSISDEGVLSEKTITWNLNVNDEKQVSYDFLDNKYGGKVTYTITQGYPFTHFFKDPALAQAIADHFDKNANDVISEYELSVLEDNISYIGEDKKIKSLEGISYLKSISNLDLSNNDIKDLKPLKNMDKLRVLKLDYNEISNVDGLDTLTKIETLGLKANHISNLSKLESIYNDNMKVYFSGKVIQPFQSSIRNAKSNLKEEAIKSSANRMLDATNQSIVLEEVEKPTDGKLTLDQLAYGILNEAVPATKISDYGVYENEKISYKNLDKQTQVSYEFNSTTSHGKVTNLVLRVQDYNEEGYPSGADAFSSVVLLISSKDMLPVNVLIPFHDKETNEDYSKYIDFDTLPNDFIDGMNNKFNYKLEKINGKEYIKLAIPYFPASESETVGKEFSFRIRYKKGISPIDHKANLKPFLYTDDSFKEIIEGTENLGNNLEYKVNTKLNDFYNSTSNKYLTNYNIDNKYANFRFRPNWYVANSTIEGITWVEEQKLKWSIKLPENAKYEEGKTRVTYSRYTGVSPNNFEYKYDSATHSVIVELTLSQRDPNPNIMPTREIGQIYGDIELVDLNIEDEVWDGSTNKIVVNEDYKQKPVDSPYQDVHTGSWQYNFNNDRAKATIDYKLVELKDRDNKDYGDLNFNKVTHGSSAKVELNKFGALRNSKVDAMKVNYTNFNTTYETLKSIETGKYDIAGSSKDSYDIYYTKQINKTADEVTVLEIKDNFDFFNNPEIDQNKLVKLGTYRFDVNEKVQLPKDVTGIFFDYGDVNAGFKPETYPIMNIEYTKDYQLGQKQAWSYQSEHPRRGKELERQASVYYNNEFESNTSSNNFKKEVNNFYHLYINQLRIIKAQTAFEQDDKYLLPIPGSTVEYTIEAQADSKTHKVESPIIYDDLPTDYYDLSTLKVKYILYNGVIEKDVMDPEYRKAESPYFDSQKISAPENIVNTKYPQENGRDVSRVAYKIDKTMQPSDNLKIVYEIKLKDWDSFPEQVANNKFTVNSYIPKTIIRSTDNYNHTSKPINKLKYNHVIPLPQASRYNYCNQNSVPELYRYCSNNSWNIGSKIEYINDVNTLENTPFITPTLQDNIVETNTEVQINPETIVGEKLEIFSDLENDWFDPKDWYNNEEIKEYKRVSAKPFTEEFKWNKTRITINKFDDNKLCPELWKNCSGQREAIKANEYFVTLSTNNRYMDPVEINEDSFTAKVINKDGSTTAVDKVNIEKQGNTNRYKLTFPGVPLRLGSLLEVDFESRINYLTRAYYYSNQDREYTMQAKLTADREYNVIVPPKHEAIEEEYQLNKNNIIKEEGYLFDVKNNVSMKSQNINEPYYGESYDKKVTYKMESNFHHEAPTKAYLGTVIYDVPVAEKFNGIKSVKYNGKENGITFDYSIKEIERGWMIHTSPYETINFNRKVVINLYKDGKPFYIENGDNLEIVYRNDVKEYRKDATESFESLYTSTKKGAALLGSFGLDDDRNTLAHQTNRPNEWPYDEKDLDNNDKTLRYGLVGQDRFEYSHRELKDMRRGINVKANPTYNSYLLESPTYWDLNINYGNHTTRQNDYVVAFLPQGFKFDPDIVYNDEQGFKDKYLNQTPKEVLTTKDGRTMIVWDVKHGTKVTDLIRFAANVPSKYASYQVDAYLMSNEQLREEQLQENDGSIVTIEDEASLQELIDTSDLDLPNKGFLKNHGSIMINGLIRFELENTINGNNIIEKGDTVSTDIVIKNAGQYIYNDLSIISKLPAKEDLFIIENIKRGSSFSPTFKGIKDVKITSNTKKSIAKEDYKIWYTTNNIRSVVVLNNKNYWNETEILNDTIFNWKTEEQVNLNDVTGFYIQVTNPDIEVKSGEKMVVTYDMKFPDVYDFVDEKGNREEGIIKHNSLEIYNTFASSFNYYTRNINTGEIEQANKGKINAVEVPKTKAEFIVNSIGNRVWSDHNGDGIQNKNSSGIYTEPGIKDAKVELYEYDNPDEIVASTQTNEEGYYYLQGVGKGNYRVRVTLPNSYTYKDYLFTSQNTGSDDTINSKIIVDSTAHNENDVLQGNTNYYDIEKSELNHTLDAGIKYNNATNGSVLVKYVDQLTNEEIATSTLIIGPEGKDYQTKPKTIDHYDYSDSTGETQGTIENGIQKVVIYKYDKVKSTVTFDKNHIDAQDGDITMHILNYGSSLKEEQKALGNPIRVGYKLIEFNSQPDGKGEKFDLNTIVTDDVVVYAQWKIERTEVTFDKNYDLALDGSITSHQVDYNSTLAISNKELGNPTATNYGDLVGWNTKADGSGITFGLNTRITKPITVYAQWQHNITYDGNTNTGGSVPIDNNNPYETNDEVAILENKSLVKEGYTFKEWNTKAIGNGTSYNKDDKFNIDRHITLYAIWDVDQITVTFDKNYSYATDGTITTQTVDYNTSIAESNKELGNPTATEYGNLISWNTKADGSGTEFTKQDKITKDITVYAQWQHQVTYNGNGNTSGDVPADNKNPYDTNAEVNIKDRDNLEKTDYIFEEWNTKADGTGTSYLENSKFNIDKHTTLYAQWKNNVAKVTFDKNAPQAIDGTITEQTLTKGNSLKDEDKALGNPTYTGYTLVGWCTDTEKCLSEDNTTKASTQFSELTSVSDDITVYAQWKINKIQVTFDKNYNLAVDGSIKVQTVDYGSSLVQDNKELGNPTATGYGTLVSWNTEADGSGVEFNKQTQITSDLTVYAQWNHTLTYHGNTNTSGEAPVDSKSPYKTNSNVSVKENEKLIKLGHTFKEWNTSSDGNGQGYDENERFVINKHIDLYAIWDIDQITVTFDKNYDLATNGSIRAQTVDYDTSLTDANKELGNPTATNYGELVSWNTKADGSGTEFTKQDKITKDITVYAQWQHEITYDGNTNTGGSAPVDSDNPYSTKEEVIVLGKGTLEKDGHTFKEWNTKANGNGTSYSKDASFEIDRHITLYAIWDIDQITVTFDKNYDLATNGSITAQTVDYDTSLTDANKELGNPTATNYGELVSWNTKADGSGAEFTKQDKITKDITVYAQWQHEITYDGNTNTGGSAPVDSHNPYSTKEEVIVLGKGTLEKDGHTFKEWNTKANGNGTSYSKDASFEIDRHITLYAIWKIDTPVAQYTLSYDGNGNTSGNAPSSTTVSVAQNVNVSGNINNLVKDGYTFDGWNTDQLGNGTRYIENDDIMLNKDIILYAQWKKDTPIAQYTLTYDGNGHTNGSVPSSTTVSTAQNVSVSGNINNLAKDGYTFNGWNTDELGNGVAYVENEDIMLDRDIILYAQWKEDIPVIQYTLSYDGNSHTSGTEPESVLVNEIKTVEVSDNVNNLKKTGYIFIGWNTRKDGTGDNYVAGSNILVDKNIKLYAKWQEKDTPIETYTLTYDGNTNTSGNVPDSITNMEVKDVIISGNINKLEKTGYMFIGWNTDASGNGESFVKGDKLKLDQDTVLYAQWKKDTPSNEIILKYNGNTNTGGKVPQSVKVATPTNIKVSTKGGLVKTNYEFIKWNTKANGSGIDYKESSNIYLSKNTILYAQWARKPVQPNPSKNVVVTFKKNHTKAVDGSIKKQTLAKGATLAKEQKELGNPTRKGYKLVSWNTKQDGTGKDFNRKSIVKKNLTVYAQWEKNSSVKPVESTNPNIPKTGSSLINYLIASLSVTMLGSSVLKRRKKDN